MKKISLLLVLFLLCSCKPTNAKNSIKQYYVEQGYITEEIHIENLQYIGKSQRLDKSGDLITQYHYKYDVLIYTKENGYKYLTYKLDQVGYFVEYHNQKYFVES